MRQRSASGPCDGDLAAADRRQARVGDARDDAEHGAHGRVPPEVVDAEVAQEQHRGGEAEGRADPEADAADETAAHDAATRLGCAEKIERRLVRAGDGLRYPRTVVPQPRDVGPQIDLPVPEVPQRPRRMRSTIALPRPSAPSGPTESTTKPPSSNAQLRLDGVNQRRCVASRGP